MIDDFIKRFSGDSVEVFTCGCCYWFAVILHERYKRSTIMYSPLNHFGTKINGRIYDITGDVTDSYPDWIAWDEYDDSTHKKRLIKQCINF